MLTWGLAIASACISATARPSLRHRLLDGSYRAWARHKKSFSASIGQSPMKKLVEEHPYPVAPPDTSMFEELTSEYSLSSSSVLELSPFEEQAHLVDAQHAPCYPLYRAVEEGRYGDAEGIRLDLVTMGVSIRSDPVYALPALQILQTAEDSQRVRGFAAWLSLLPPLSDAHARLSEVEERLQAILESLMRMLDHTDDTGLPDLRLAMVLAMVCVQKGYTSHLPLVCIQRVMRLAAPAQAVQFLDELILAHEHSLGHSQEVDHTLLSKWYAASIRAQCATGRYNLGNKLLKDAAARDVTVDDGTVSLLYKKLEAARLPVPAELQGPKEIRTAVTEEVYSLSLAEDVDIDRNINIVQYLRLLRTSMTSSHPPHAKAIANFLIAYRAMRRSRAAELLYKKAMRRKVTQRGWAIAEMIYQLQKNRPRHALIIYAHTFLLTAVPKAIVEDTIQRTRLRREFAATTPVLQDKLDPSAADTVYAWTALLRLHTTRERTELLYAYMIHKMATAKHQADVFSAVETPEPPQQSEAVENKPSDEHEALAHIPGEEVPALPSPKTMLSPYYFVPFLQALGERNNPRRAARVFVDMANLRIEPDIFCYTALAGVYAAAGRTGRCLMILDQMETWSNVFVDGEGGVQYVRPNLVTYTTVLRGLVDSRRLSGALMIRQRLQEKLGYVYGTSPYTDRALDLVHALERTQDQRAPSAR